MSVPTIPIIDDNLVGLVDVFPVLVNRSRLTATDSLCHPESGAANWTRSGVDAADLYSTGRGFLHAH